MDLQSKYRLAYLFVSHDLSVVRHISNRIAVMYLGQIVETAATDALFQEPKHPYSIALLSAVPQVTDIERSRRIVLKGDVPSPINPSKGCRFAPRCWMARTVCFNNDPPLREVGNNHKAACHFAEEAVKKANDFTASFRTAK